MSSKKDAAREALQAALDSWNWRAPPSSRGGAASASSEVRRPLGVRTELSTTVFSAEPEDWVRYLKLPPEQRHEPDLGVRVHLQRDWRLVAFEAENEQSRWLEQLLDQGLRHVRRRLEATPHVLGVLDELAFGVVGGLPTQAGQTSRPASRGRPSASRGQYSLD